MANEVRLIDANALQGRICKAKCNREYEDCRDEGDCEFDFFIFWAPTIDPESLRPKSEWIAYHNIFDGYEHHRCSHCGTDAPFVYTYIEEWDEDMDGEWDYIGQRENGIEEQMGSFCPYCGAKMEE